MKKFMKKYEEFASRYNSKDYLILRIPFSEDASSTSKRVLENLISQTYSVDDTTGGIYGVCQQVANTIKNPNINYYIPNIFADLCTEYDLENITKHGFLVHDITYINKGNWFSCPKLVYYNVQKKEVCSLEPFPEYPEKNGYVLGIAGKPGNPIFDKVYKVLDHFANSYYGSVKYDIEEVDHPDLDKRFTYFRLTKV